MQYIEIVEHLYFYFYIYLLVNKDLIKILFKSILDILWIICGQVYLVLKTMILKMFI